MIINLSLIILFDILNLYIGLYTGIAILLHGFGCVISFGSVGWLYVYDLLDAKGSAKCSFTQMTCIFVVGIITPIMIEKTKVWGFF